MKKFILGGLLLFASVTGQAQSSKTFIKSFVNSSNQVTIETECTKVIKNWDNSYLRIYLTIESNVSESILGSLATAGRYDHVAKLENGVLVITMPNLVRQVSIGGVPIIEKLTMEVFLPDSVTILQPSI